MAQLISFIPSARTLWLLAGGGLFNTVIAILIPPPQGVGIAAVLTFGWYFTILILAGIDAWRSKADRIIVSREQLGKLSIGRDNSVKLTIAAPPILDKARQFRYQIRDGVPPDLAATPELISGKVNADNPQSIAYTVHPYSRGEYDWQGIQIRQLSRWGLAWQQWRIDAAQTVAVYPDLVGLKALSIRLTLQGTGAMRQIRKQGIGT